MASGTGTGTPASSSGESTLSSQYSDLQKAIGHSYGIGMDTDNWTENQTSIVDMIIKKGLRQFYFPPRVYEGEAPHEWGFLKPTVTLDTVGSYSTGTIAITNGETTVTLSDGTWPSWAYTHGTLVVDNTEYSIASRDSDTELTLSSAWSEDTITEDDYTLRHNGNYDLPDDYGGIEGNMTFEPSEFKPGIRIVGEGRIRSLRSGQTTRQYPRYAAIRPKTTDGTGGQRFEVLFFPIPNDAYALSYKKLILASALTAVTKYPYGGAMHAETIEASCLAALELQEDEQRGPKYQHFMERLAASIQIDKKSNSADYFGYIGDNSDAVHRDSPSRVHTPTMTNFVTYNGDM